MVGPWLNSLWERGGGKLSDIEYLAVKEFDGKISTAEGTVTATGDIATITAGSGDMYLAKAKVSARSEATGVAAGTVIVELKVNGTIKATWSCDLGMTTSGDGTGTSSYEFAIAGLKVTTGQIIKLEAVTVDTNIEINGELICVEEATGASPVAT